MQEAMNLKQYKSEILSIQILVLASPFVAKLFDKKSPLPFPPLGDNVGMWRLFAALFIAASILIPYFVHPVKRIGITIVGLFFLLLCSGSIYLYLNSNYVVPIHSAGEEIAFVTKGTDRNPNLKEPYRSMTDKDLIEHSGTRDGFLEDAYTNHRLTGIAGSYSRLTWQHLSRWSFYLGRLRGMNQLRPNS
jgi:hypothetical protein